MQLSKNVFPTKPKGNKVTAVKESEELQNKVQSELKEKDPENDESIVARNTQYGRFRRNGTQGDLEDSSGASE